MTWLKIDDLSIDEAYNLLHSIQDVLVEGEEKEIFFDDTKAIIDQELAERDHIFLLLNAKYE